MDIMQIALLVVAVNLGVLGVGAIVALVRSVARRRREPRTAADGQTQHSAN